MGVEGLFHGEQYLVLAEWKRESEGWQRRRLSPATVRENGWPSQPCGGLLAWRRGAVRVRDIEKPLTRS